MKLGKLSMSAAGLAAMILFAAAPAALAKGKPTPPPNLVSAACGDGTVVISPAYLWPPHHKLATINVAYTETASDTDSISIAVNSITDDQLSEDDGTDGGTDNCGPALADWVSDSTPVTNTDPNAAATTVQLRSERCANIPASESNHDRHYDLNLTCGNADGSTATIDMFVTVPHDKHELKVLEGLVK